MTSHESPRALVVNVYVGGRNVPKRPRTALWGEFGRRKKREVFAPVHVRLLCEVGAIAPVREWKSASGEFRTRAALVVADDEKVTLRKLDMEEIDVPISALSKPDQKYLARVKKNIGPAAGGLAAAVPPREIVVERFAVREGYGSQEGSPADATERVALEPDPLPSYLTLPQGGAVVPNAGFSARISAVLAVGGPDGWVLGAVENVGGFDAAPTQLIWVSLARNKIEGRQLLPPGEMVLDYHPPSHRLLTRAWEDSMAAPRAGESEARPLTVWEVLPADNRATPIARWDPEAEMPESTHPDPMQWSAVSDRWTRLADGNTVIQPWRPNELAAWDVAAKRMRYRLARNTSLFRLPTLTGTRKYLFLPENERVRVLDSLTGRVLSILPTSYYVNAVAVSDDGRRVATAGAAW